MSFSLLTNVMPVFYSTKYYNRYHYIYIVALPLCSATFIGCSSPIRKLLKYSHCQSCGGAHRHLVGSHPQHHPYCIILH